jgi:sugar/nucleoside kinase (ribokinase family)
MYANDGAELLAIYQRVHATRTITSLDMALPDPNTPGGQFEWKGLLKRLLPSVDVFLPSLEEIMYMLRREDYLRAEGRIMGRVTRATVRAIGEELLAMGLAVAGVKLGEYGFYLRTTADRKRLARLETLGIDVDAWTDVEIWQPTFDVKVVGTTGAGDSAYAGFLAALLRRLSPADAVRFACAVGASNTEAADASSGVRSWDETIRRVQSGWRESNLQLPES